MIVVDFTYHIAVLIGVMLPLNTADIARSVPTAARCFLILTKQYAMHRAIEHRVVVLQDVSWLVALCVVHIVTEMIDIRLFYIVEAISYTL